MDCYSNRSSLQKHRLLELLSAPYGSTWTLQNPQVCEPNLPMPWCPPLPLSSKTSTAGSNPTGSSAPILRECHSTDSPHGWGCSLGNGGAPHQLWQRVRARPQNSPGLGTEPRGTEPSPSKHANIPARNAAPAARQLPCSCRNPPARSN